MPLPGIDLGVYVSDNSTFSLLLNGPNRPSLNAYGLASEPESASAHSGYYLSLGYPEREEFAANEDP